MHLLGRLATNVFALLIVDTLIPGMRFASLWTAVVASIAIGIVNTLIKPIIQLIALPFSILTFGITAVLINVILLWGTASLVPGFEISNFLSALTASILLSLVSWFLTKLTRS